MRIKCFATKKMPVPRQASRTAPAIGPSMIAAEKYHGHEPNVVIAWKKNKSICRTLLLNFNTSDYSYVVSGGRINIQCFSYFKIMHATFY